MALPPCGLYRTTAEVAGVPAGRLVYFHNHGDPGPGIYLPTSWRLNRATFDQRGHTLKDDDDAGHLASVAGEGLYVVKEAFWCCEKHCRRFEPDTLVQLGYNAGADPILFLPTLGDSGLGLPDRGSKTSHAELAKLSRLKVAREDAPVRESPSGLPH